eukprot:scaffold23142_cov33-Tisochrysis_lutea.AAC.3
MLENEAQLKVRSQCVEHTFLVCVPRPDELELEHAVCRAAIAAVGYPILFTNLRCASPFPPTLQASARSGKLAVCGCVALSGASLVKQARASCALLRATAAAREAISMPRLGA